MTDDRDVVLGDPDATGTTKERRGAGLYDILVLGWAIGVIATPIREVAPLVADGSLFGLWLVLVLTEGLTGASPGKHVTGLRVVRLDDAAVTMRTAAVRRPWGWLLPLQFAGDLPNAIATAVALAVLLWMLISVERSPDRRGFHDRFAGTTVVDATFDRRARLVVVLLTVAVALAGILLAAQLAPVTPA